MSRALPYYKMYPGDAETDENFRAMSDEELGYYWRCLNHAWLNDGLPSDAEERSRAFKLSQRKEAKLWVRVGRCFRPFGVEGRIFNARQEAERTKAILKSKQASCAVSERERKRNERCTVGSSSDDPCAYESESGSKSSVRKKEKPEVYLGQLEDFETFWRYYWRKVGRAGPKGAKATFWRQVESHQLFEKVHSAEMLQLPAMLCREMESRPHATTWLNQHRWEDDPAAYAVSAQNGSKPMSRMERLNRELEEA